MDILYTIWHQVDGVLKVVGAHLTLFHLLGRLTGYQWGDRELFFVHYLLYIFIYTYTFLNTYIHIFIVNIILFFLYILVNSFISTRSSTLLGVFFFFVILSAIPLGRRGANERLCGAEPAASLNHNRITGHEALHKWLSSSTSFSPWRRIFIL